MPFFQVIALDLDGTLASGGRVSAQALDAIRDARQKGLTLVLATGRIRAELAAEFPHIVDVFDALVLENGAVVVVNGHTTVVTEPVDKAFDDALARRRVPYRRARRWWPSTATTPRASQRP
ncbi:HAD family hydrolase [Mycobacterium bohemicum DSM 44277]|uniref:HAD family hydrolase n=1 Tax=Mycobacterium bohemicum DSM 44277 TaxID=1236609 RepID=A0A0U0W628_MYCBE|nr:HAD hydrolase family protein [Mycobacterium bohemicum]CPR07836.1 HAD family hydrolase [Mycobacterium bohemicum DSM 44277]